MGLFGAGGVVGGRYPAFGVRGSLRDLLRSGHVASRGSAVGQRGRRRGCARPGGHRLRRWVRFVRHSAGRHPASSGRLGGALTRWSQIPIWDPSADDSDRYSFLNAERIPQGMRPGKDSGPSGLGLFGRRELLRCWLLAFGRRGLVFSFQRAGKGAFSNQQSALSRQSDKGQNMGGAPEGAGGAERRRIADVLDVGFVWRGGAVRVAAGRRPASSGRLGRALTCPTCYLLAFGWRIGIVMDAECGKDSAGDAARKGFRAERGSGPQIMGLTQMKNRKKVFEHEVTETGLRVPPRRLRCIHLLLVPYSTICQESRVDPDTPPSARPEGRRPRGRRLHIQTGEISALSERRWHKIHNNSKYKKKLVSFSQQYWHGR